MGKQRSSLPPYSCSAPSRQNWRRGFLRGWLTFEAVFFEMNTPSLHHSIIPSLQFPAPGSCPASLPLSMFFGNDFIDGIVNFKVLVPISYH
jgi:hypothetical protein